MADNDFGDVSVYGKNKGNTKLPPVILPVSMSSENYCMDLPKVGKCYIFNHKEFAPHTGLDIRKGTDEDKRKLICTFLKLKFDFEDIESDFDDLTVRQIHQEFKKAGEMDYTNYSCVVCCILTHGNTGILCAKDGNYALDDLFAPFKGDVCPTLIGKPKIFIIQACQGDEYDEGVNVVCKDSSDAILEKSFKISKNADFLIIHSTVPGFRAWKNRKRGSWFIQALCSVLEDHAKDKDLLQLLTIVNRKVAFEFESYTPDDASSHQKKQVPYVMSTLTRNIKFPVK